MSNAALAGDTILVMPGGCEIVTRSVVWPQLCVQVKGHDVACCGLLLIRMKNLRSTAGETKLPKLPRSLQEPHFLMTIQTSREWIPSGNWTSRHGSRYLTTANLSIPKSLYWTESNVAIIAPRDEPLLTAYNNRKWWRRCNEIASN